jgi:hypothetical protein
MPLLASSLLLTLSASTPGAAQETHTQPENPRIAITLPDLSRPNLAQFNPDGAPAESDTVIHAKHRSNIVFTDSLPSSDEPDTKLSPRPRPEGIHDDFDNNTPTGWWIYTGQSVTDIQNTINNDNARIIDLEVDSTSPYSFTVTYVQNTGAYAKGWWWYYGVTAAQVASEISTNNARLISLKAYDIGNGQIRFAVVMIPNTGADQKGWWYYFGESVSNLSSLATSNNARLVTVDPYTTGGNTYYTAIMISNTGADADSWWWYIDATPNTLANAVSQNRARIFYLTGNSNGTFNAIMEGCPNGCSEWWYYYGQTGQQMLNLAVQNGARMVNFASYPGCGGLCYAGAMINNSNAITTRVGNLIRNGGIGGTEGLYLKQVNGPVLANLEDSVPFEPASTIKVLANLYSMTKVQNGSATLATPITHYTNGPESCPNPPVVSGTEPLEIALREMMYHSDNARTREITDHFGDTAINNYAAGIGMKNSGFHEIVGCIGTTPDSLTLDDAGVLYEGVANQTLLNTYDRGIFYSNMAGRAQYYSEGYDWTGIWDSDIPNIINQVAPAGYTAQQKTNYYNAMNLAYKAGNYVICTNSNCSNVVEDISESGWFQLPVCGNNSATYAEYVFGIMFSNEPYSGWSNGVVTPTDQNFTTAKGELLREQIQAGMTSCLGKSLDVLFTNPTDLVFSTTPVGHTAVAKSITLTNKQYTAATGLSVSVFGDFTESNTCGSSLAAGKSCTITVTFSPTATGERTGSIIIGDSGTGQPQTVQLTGTGQ